ncbi:conserved Plasmodium protein, unknown function [Plasmodium ovale curtisi]|uniref:Inhibitor of growth protein N-terminal histone-binding domain-containing protein n=1 Tax=Plasmodium ovale curtisi TaxID=864141 RepID=A0A1A8WE54_PLAOA|nr:conserved Plasmodium protein, unknown function [Plasmodium ovale curtisi]
MSDSAHVFMENIYHLTGYLHRLLFLMKELDIKEHTINENIKEKEEIYLDNLDYIHKSKTEKQQRGSNEESNMEIESLNEGSYKNNPNEVIEGEEEAKEETQLYRCLTNEGTISNNGEKRTDHAISTSTSNEFVKRERNGDGNFKNLGGGVLSYIKKQDTKVEIADEEVKDQRRDNHECKGRRLSRDDRQEKRQKPHKRQKLQQSEYAKNVENEQNASDPVDRGAFEKKSKRERRESSGERGQSPHEDFLNGAPNYDFVEDHGEIHPCTHNINSGDEETHTENIKQVTIFSEEELDVCLSEIMNEREQCMALLREKICINSQISHMIRNYYEKLKKQYDKLYTEMEMNGESPPYMHSISRNRNIPHSEVDDYGTGVAATSAVGNATIAGMTSIGGSGGNNGNYGSGGSVKNRSSHTGGTYQYDLYELDRSKEDDNDNPGGRSQARKHSVKYDEEYNPYNVEKNKRTKKSKRSKAESSSHASKMQKIQNPNPKNDQPNHGNDKENLCENGNNNNEHVVTDSNNMAQVNTDQSKSIKTKENTSGEDGSHVESADHSNNAVTHGTPAEGDAMENGIEKKSDEKKNDEKKNDEKKNDEKKNDEKKNDEKKNDEKKNDEKKNDEKKNDKKKNDEKKNDEKKNDEKKNDEKKNDEKKNDEKKNDEKKNDEKKSAEKKSAEKKSDEKKGSEKKSDEKRGNEKKSGEKKSGEKKSGEKKSGEKKSGEKKSGEKKSGEKKSGEKKSGEKKSGEKRSIERRDDQAKDVAGDSKDGKNADNSSEKK